MAEIITNNGLQLLAQHQGNNTALVIDTIVLGYTVGQLPSDTISPDRGYPVAGEIVYTSPVTYSGYMSPDMVVYSLNIGEDVGPFVFNTLYCVASGDSNAVVMVITLPDTQKIATDITQGIRGQAMIRNAVMVYAGAQQITNVTVEAAAWQFAYQKATTVVYGITREALIDEVIAGTQHGIFVSPPTLNEWYFSMMESWFISQVWVFGTDDLPAGFPGFIHNGSTVPNGVIDYPKLANSGYKWITIDGDDLIIHDAPDVIRGQGSSSRAVGDFQGDMIRNIIGSLGKTGNYGALTDVNSSGAGTMQGSGAINVTKVGSSGAINSNRAQFDMDFDASRVVPTGPENTVKSKTGLIACYHGEFTK